MLSISYKVKESNNYSLSNFDNFHSTFSMDEKDDRQGTTTKMMDKEQQSTTTAAATS